MENFELLNACWAIIMAKLLKKKFFFTILPHTVVKAGMSYSLLVFFMKGS